MGFGPQGPRVLPAVQDQSGLGQFASGIESILTKAKEQRDFTQGTEAFEKIVEKYTDEDGNTDFQKVDFDVASSRDITTPNKQQFHQVAQKAQEQKIAKQKAGAERTKADKDFREQVTAEANAREFGELQEDVNEGRKTPQQASAVASKFIDKDVRNLAVGHFGKAIDSEAREKAGVAKVRTEADVKEIGDLRKKLSDDAVAGKEVLDAVEIGKAGVNSPKGTGPGSAAHFADIFGSFDSPLLKAIGTVLQSEPGQALKTSTLNQVKGSLRSTFGARPLGVEFEFLIQKLARAGNTKANNLIALDMEAIRAQTMVMKEKLFNDVRKHGRANGLKEQEQLELYREEVDEIESSQLNSLTTMLRERLG